MREEPVRWEGSGEGEGGGQVLRTALCLSLITGRAFHLRTSRDAPAPRPQHLACVRAARALCGGRGEGFAPGEPGLFFEPGPVRAGDYVLEVGAGVSTPLLFQCLVYPLALAGGGTLTLRGGTHLPHGPGYHYLAGVWRPMARAFGLSTTLRLTHAGFYPEGGGEFLAEVSAPRAPPHLVEWTARGVLQDIAVGSFVGGLPFGLAERQSRAAVAALRERGLPSHAENRLVSAPRSAGTETFLLAQFERSLAGFTALGARGVPPEDVGREAAEGLARFMESGGAVDEHLGDQLLVPAALLAAGRLGPVSPGTTRYTPARVTPHLTTQARLLERFLPVRVTVEPDGTVAVSPATPP